MSQNCFFNNSTYDYIIKLQWDSVILYGSIPQGEIEHMIDNSSMLVVSKMTKKCEHSLQYIFSWLIYDIETESFIFRYCANKRSSRINPIFNRKQFWYKFVFEKNCHAVYKSLL